METTDIEIKLTRREKWRIYDAFYKKVKYDNNPEYRKRKQEIALKSYHKRKAERAAIAAAAAAAPPAPSQAATF